MGFPGKHVTELGPCTSQQMPCDASSYPSWIGGTTQSGDRILMKVSGKSLLSTQFLTLSTAKFLFSLGLQRYPPLPELLKIVSGSDKALRELALAYLFEKHVSQYQDYQPGNFADVTFIPALQPDGTEFLAKHSQVRTIGYSSVEQI